jgi:hypothetical protein
MMDLAEPGRRVLLVEDHQPWLARLERFCIEAGHETYSLTGVSEVEGDTLRGPGMSGQVTVDLLQVDAAFLDHYFVSARYNGELLTRELMHRRPVRICGMSSDAAANAAMVRQGAVAALRKADMMRLFS